MAKILIIEDDADIAAIERDYLEVGGYERSASAPTAPPDWPRRWSSPLTCCFST